MMVFMTLISLRFLYTFGILFVTIKYQTCCTSTNVYVVSRYMYVTQKRSPPKIPFVFPTKLKYRFKTFWLKFGPKTRNQKKTLKENIYFAASKT